MKLVRFLAVVSTIVLALSMGGIAWANTGAAIGAMEGTITPEPSVTPEPTQADQKVAQAIADEYEVDVKDIIALHQEGLGYGEIAKAYALAEITGKSVEDILAMKKEERGWGEIAQELKVDPGKWDPNLGKVINENKPKDNPGQEHRASSSNDNDKGNNGNGNSNDKDKDNGKGKNK